MSRNFWIRHTNNSRKDWTCESCGGSIERGDSQIHYEPGKTNWQWQGTHFRYHPGCDPGYSGLPSSNW